MLLGICKIRGPRLQVDGVSGPSQVAYLKLVRWELLVQIGRSLNNFDPTKTDKPTDSAANWYNRFVTSNRFDLIGISMSYWEQLTHANASISFQFELFRSLAVNSLPDDEL